MTDVSEKIRAWGRRLLVGAAAAVTLPGLIGLAGGAATAGAFSRPGLPVEYLQVPSAGMGRDIKRSVLKRWRQLARAVPA